MYSTQIINSYWLDLAIFRLRLPALLIAVSAAAFYYGVPLAASLYDGSCVTNAWLVEHRELLKTWESAYSSAIGATAMRSGVGYCLDRVHALFSVLVFFVP